MNWKLLLISLSLVVGILARPADEPKPEATTSKTTSGTKKLNEKPQTEQLIATTTTTSPRLLKSSDASTTARYLHQINQTKPTNSRAKHANNYANLITKHTLKVVNKTSGGAANNINVDNLSFNITWGESKSKINKNASPSTITSTEAPSIYSSRPLVFIDADGTSTTNRAFVQLMGGNPNHGTWSNYNLEDIGTAPPMRKKATIHKIISKWSDNPHEVFNLQSEAYQDPFINSHHAQLNEISNHIVQSAFSNRVPTTSSSNDNLPITVGQQMLHELQHMASTKNPVVKSSSKKPIIVASTVHNIVMNNNEKPIKTPSAYSKDNCLIRVGNKVITNYDECKKYHVDNKVENMDEEESKDEDKTVGFDIEVETEAPPTQHTVVEYSETDYLQEESPSKLVRRKNKRKKPKPGFFGGNKDHESSASSTSLSVGSLGSVGLGLLAVMATFNPLNFGVWGIIMAPLAAMLFGGACIAMYQYMSYQSKKPVWQPPPPPLKYRAQEVSIPVKVTHLHKHLKSYGPPIHEYSPPWRSSEPVKSFAEPPHDYRPPPPMGGPYQVKKSMKSTIRKKSQKPSPFRFKLL